jgi:enoyl-CoA hydratase/carnithine racemase
MDAQAPGATAREAMPDEAMPDEPAGARDAVLLERREGAVAWLVLNRPRALNALDEPLLAALDAALARLAGDPTLGALVVTGAGRAFSLGADLGALDAGDAAARRARFAALLPLFQGVIRQLAELPVPTLAAVNGFATGAGFDLALACDLRVASERAKLGSAFVGMGLVPDGGGTHHLPRLAGTARALELVLLGDAIEPAAALAAGIVYRVVPAAELAAAAGDLAARLAAAPRPAALLARRLVRAGATRPLAAALAAEAEAQLECAASAAFAAALAARARRRGASPPLTPPDGGA